MKKYFASSCLIVILLSFTCFYGCDNNSKLPETDVDIVLSDYSEIENRIIVGWCGPSAVSWVYSGIFDAYEGVPLSESLYDLVDYIESNYTHPILWEGKTNWYMLEPDIKKAVEDITDGEYTIEDFNSHEWDDARDWLTDYNLPLFSLISRPEGWHWRVVYGVYYSVEEGVLYYRMHDNGAQEGVWMEEQASPAPLVYQLCGLKRLED